MRSEKEMLELIVQTANCDERIRAVILNGSRTNPSAPRDIFQDYDVLYVVTDVEPFVADPSWIARFGETLILQMPELMQAPPPQNDGTFSFLMQFVDGNRIDLTLVPVAKFEDLMGDSLSMLILDKDDVIEPFPSPSELDYLPKPPTAKAFSDCCNEFWWVSLYAAKGLWREEILYAKHVIDRIVRNELMKMLIWHMGTRTQFQCNPGKAGKYLKNYIETELWEMLKRTYSDASYERTWDSLFVMCDLFRRTAKEVAKLLGFEYPERDDEKASAHLKHVWRLPKNAPKIY